VTEEGARAWLQEQFGSDASAQLQRYAGLISHEAVQQNLVSASTLESIWVRHLVDSAQLLSHAKAAEGEWVDIGSGAGLPGLVVAILSTRHVTLVEPRRLRAEFLLSAAERLGIQERVTVAAMKSQRLVRDTPAAVISARAVSALPQLLASAAHLADRRTLWLLPKGRSAQSEVAAARQAWHGVFHVETSLTDPEAGIVTARGVYRR
jgi:16S rRNA (guanine527-N7)-methyltransferase